MNRNRSSNWQTWCRRGAYTTIAFCATFLSAVSHADPAGGQVVRGDAAITNDAGLTTIDQTSNRAVILWDDFSIATDEVVRFNQPSVDAATLNRVTGSAASIIEGLLTANGNILIINPAGILFSESARVDVGGLVATTADIADDNFMRGDLDFSIVAPNGSTVTNRGIISVAGGGLAALVAPGVENTGVIQARLGRVALGSGNQFTLDLYGDGLIRLPVAEADLATMVTADGKTLATAIGNTGTIEADGGRVYLLASTASHVLDQAIKCLWHYSRPYRRWFGRQYCPCGRVWSGGRRRCSRCFWW